MIRKPHPKLIEFLSAYRAPVPALALALRKMVIQQAPTATEMVWDAYSAVAIGFTYSGRQKEAFIHIASYSSHVNLGFNWGAKLPDPDGVLQGSGSQIRHIRIATPADLKNPQLKKFIGLAIRHSELMHPSRVPQQVIVRVMKTKKRRRPGKKL